MTAQQERYGLEGRIGGGNGQIAGANSGTVFVPCGEPAGDRDMSPLDDKDRIIADLREQLKNAILWDWQGKP